MTRSASVVRQRVRYRVRSPARAVSIRFLGSRWLALSIAAIVVCTTGCVRSAMEVSAPRVDSMPEPEGAPVPVRVAAPGTRPDAADAIATEASRPPLVPFEPPRLPLESRDVNLRGAGYDVSVGFGVGVVFPGAQDLKFKRYGANGALSDYLFSDVIDSAIDHLDTVDVTAWRTRGALDGFGVRVEAARWSTRATARSFVDRLTGGSSVASPPFRSVGEERLGFFVTAARRWSLSKESAAEDSPYAFVGLGYGEIYSQVTHGLDLWHLGFEAYAGVAFPVMPGIRFRIEGSFLLAHDVDVTGAPADWAVDTSGRHLWGHSTFDTRFFALSASFEFRF